MLDFQDGREGTPVDAALPASVREAESVLTALASVFFTNAQDTGGKPRMRLEPSVSGKPERPDVEDIYRILVDQIPAVVCVAFLDKGLSEAYVSPQIEHTLGFTQEEWLGDPVRWYQQIHPEDKARWSVEAAHTLVTGDPLRSVYRVLARDGRVVWFHCEVKVVRHADGRPWFIHGVGFDITNLKVAEAELQRAQNELEARVRERTAALQRVNAELRMEIAERQRAEAERQELNRRLVETSRQIGRAEVAINVLHNVGNVLNSINVTAELVSKAVRHSLVGDVSRISALLQAHASDLGEYMTSDPIGKQIPGYLTTLAAHLTQEQTQVLKDLEALSGMIEHVKQVITMQQSLARFGSMQESVQLAELMEQALHINLATLEQQHVDIIREYDEHATMITDKHHVLQILINLIGNARDAMLASASPSRLRLCVGPAEGREGFVRFQVADTGIGIQPEHLTRIFSQGFTTKHGGHGFGLHSSALAAKRLGGVLSAYSAGAGQGATFTLDLPAIPETPPVQGSALPC
jgi:PAS domain S-box-containing protein